MQRETAKTAYLDTVACRQRVTHLLQDTFYCQFDILLRQVALLPGDGLNQV